MTQRCGCCASCLAAGSLPIKNRPGLSRVPTRIGTRGTFFEAMVASLSKEANKALGPLRTRRLDDPSIALLDAWAVVADVLTFYQERIANEAYLRTATERRSLIEIGRLIGYRPRPGVAASAHLAFALENETDSAEIPAGTRVNSVPAPGEKMVAFETSDAITARREWNAILPRLTRPQTPDDFTQNGGLYLKGTKTRLKPNDPILLRIGAKRLELSFVRKVVEDADADRTFVLLQDPVPPEAENPDATDSVYGIPMGALSQAGTVAPASLGALPRSIKTSFAVGADTLPRLLTAVKPALGKTLYRALRNIQPPHQPEDETIRLFAMRVNARPFGHNAPQRLTGMVERLPQLADWDPVLDYKLPQGHDERALYLDNEYDILPNSLVAIVRPGKELGESAPPLILGTPERQKKEGVTFTPQSLNAYGMSGKSVLIHWEKGADPWLGAHDNFTVVRQTRVFAGSEELSLAEAPITDDVAGGMLELGGVYDGLDAGSWLIVEGERTDIKDASGKVVPGMKAAELVMLDAVEQSSGPFQPPPSQGDGAAPPAIPPEKLRTLLTLAGKRNRADTTSSLAYRYKRDTVRIYANVARATHGETRAEVVGNGDSSTSLQTFALKQAPLTYVPAATPSGTASTLEVRVNELLWREAASLAELKATDRKYLTSADENGVTSVIFGNGLRGARPPTGRENIKAAYRMGIGTPGNVASGRLSLLATRPLGVKGVVNPLPASGGADAETLSSIRDNAPIALMALDRLVSTPDYASFARAFGGIGKAAAVPWKKLNKPKSEQDEMISADVCVVVAGVDDDPLAPDSEILDNLALALRSFGDPQVTIKVVARTRLVLVIQANVLVDPDREWALVEPKIRAALLDEFGFERIDIGESLSLARTLKAIQSVPGVTHADVDVFDQLGEADILQGITGQMRGDFSRHDLLRVKPYEIAYLSGDVADTLILQEIKQ